MSTPSLNSDTAKELFEELAQVADTEFYDPLYQAYLKLMEGDIEGAKAIIYEGQHKAQNMRRLFQRLMKSDEFRAVLAEFGKKRLKG